MNSTSDRRRPRVHRRAPRGLPRRPRRVAAHPVGLRRPRAGRGRAAAAPTGSPPKLRDDRLPGRRGVADRRRCPRSSPSGPPATPTHRPSSSTGTTTCSPRPARTAGTATRSSRWSATAGCTRAAPPTTRARSSSTPSASGPTSPRPAAPPPPSTSSCSSRARRSPAPRTSRALIRERADRLACDAVIVSDTGMWDADDPDRLHRDARPRRLRDRPVRPGPGHPLRLLRRRGAQPGHRGRPAGRRPCTTTTAGSPSPASTTGSCR